MNALHVPILSFPTIFVNGAFLGGFDQLSDAIASGYFVELQKAQRQVFPGLGSVPDPIKLLSGARGQPWYHFQLHVYANFVRALSAVHVVIFALCAALSSSSPAFLQGALWLVIADLTIFVLLGPTPFAPLCTLVTIAVWRFRGNAVTSLIYKFVFGFYVISLGGVLLCSEGGVACVGTGAMNAALGSLLINSALLAVLRL